MNIQLSEHFTYKKLLQFVLPSIVMMIFTSIYSIVDGLFVSNFVGKTAFSSLNLIYPLLMGLGSLGFMIGTGGSAVIGIALGEQRKEDANRYFSMLVYVTILGGIFLSCLGLIFIRPIALAMGATDNLLGDCLTYGRILLVSLTAFMLQNVFQSFFVTAEKPQLGLAISVISGVTNFILDYLFIVVLKMGIAGAAAATAMGQVLGAVFPVIYFIRQNNSLLQLVRTRFEGRVLLRACANGSSELMTNLSSSLVNILYNIQLLKFVGEDGVAAYGVIMYAAFIFAAIFFGYSIGSAPLISYHCGAGNSCELKNLFRKSLTLISIWGILLTLLAELFSAPLSGIFVRYDAELLNLTCRGFRIFAIVFLIMGLNVFGSSFFTALGNGAVSALISFLRTLVFQILAIFTLPVFLDVDGIWLSMMAAELLTLVVTIGFFVKMRGRYHYA